MDLVVTYDHGDEMELTYMLRSIEKHVNGIGKLYVVGARPQMIKDFIYIPFEKYGNPDANIFKRVLAAAQQAYGLTERFMYCADDYFLLEDCDAETFPYYYKGLLQDSINKQPFDKDWRKTQENTINFLQLSQCPTLNYNVHAPIVFEKKNVIKLASVVDWERDNGYLMKSLYCNVFNIRGTLFRDVKFYRPNTLAGIRAKTMGVPFFSTNVHSMNAEMLVSLQEFYPGRSRWQT